MLFNSGKQNVYDIVNKICNFFCFLILKGILCEHKSIALELHEPSLRNQYAPGINGVKLIKLSTYPCYLAPTYAPILQMHVPLIPTLESLTIYKNISPPKYIKKRGRPSLKKRIQSKLDDGTERKKNKCGNCGEAGHNKNHCTTPPPNPFASVTL